MSTLRAVLPRHGHLGSRGHWTSGLLLLLTIVAYEDQGSQGPTLPLGYMGDTGELGAPQAVQLWDPNGLGCFQEGQEATPNPVFWIHLRQFLFRSFKVFTGDLKETL